MPKNIGYGKAGKTVKKSGSSTGKAKISSKPALGKHTGKSGGKGMKSNPHRKY